MAAEVSKLRRLYAGEKLEVKILSLKIIDFYFNNEKLDLFSVAL